MRRKRGEGPIAGVEVSVMIFLLALLMVGYIILLPEEDRQELLGDDATSDNDGTSGSATEVLLSESPGEVTSARSATQIRSLEPMRLYSTTESATEELVSSLSVSRSILQNNYKTIHFDMENVENLEDLGLLFLITESRGTLTVLLNGNLVYEGELASNDLPLNLPISYIEEEGNTLELSVDLPLPNIFSANYYLLQDVQLVEDFSVSDTSSSRTFSVEDPGDVRSADLSYFITCNSDEQGILSILLNNREVFSDQIFCEYLNERELSLNEDYLGSTNTLTFEVSEGDYNIEEIDVEITSRSQDYPSFSFDVSSDLYESVSNGEKEVYFELTFADVSSQKAGTVIVQEYSFAFDTEDGSYEKEISAYVDNGANTITLQPDTSFAIDNLKVYVA